MIIRYSPMVAQWMVDHMFFLTKEQKIDTYIRLRHRAAISDPVSSNWQDA